MTNYLQVTFKKTITNSVLALSQYCQAPYGTYPQHQDAAADTAVNGHSRRAGVSHNIAKGGAHPGMVPLNLLAKMEAETFRHAHELRGMDAEARGKQLTRVRQRAQ